MSKKNRNKSFPIMFWLMVFGLLKLNIFFLSLFRLNDEQRTKSLVYQFFFFFLFSLILLALNRRILLRPERKTVAQPAQMRLKILYVCTKEENKSQVFRSTPSSSSAVAALFCFSLFLRKWANLKCVMGYRVRCLPVRCC